jgi:hypothetical protein
MHTAAPLASPDRRGITLLEVLISMFVLAVGILSIFALFTAGRELESRATIKAEAMAFASAQKDTIGRQWLDWRQWLRVAAPTFPPTFAWAKPDLPPDSGTLPIVLPVIVDPWGLCSDGEVRGPGGAWESAPDPALNWDWSRFVPLSSAQDGAAPLEEPFQRVTLSGTKRPGPYVHGPGDPVIPPFTRETALATFSDEDSIEYRLSPNANESPLNAFEGGRRKRGTDLVPALFIAAADDPAARTISLGTQVRRSLLVFHKPVPDFESQDPKQDLKNENSSWPSGVVELRVAEHEEGLIVARLTKTPVDQTAVRRSLKPGKWVLFTSRRPRPPGLAGPYFYDTAWRELMSVTQDDDGSWLIVPKTDLPKDGRWPKTPEPSLTVSLDPVAKWDNAYPAAGVQEASPIYCYGFERLVHVEELDPANPYNLP